MKQVNITIDLIVAVYNIKDYLQQCVDSLISQDLDDKKYRILLIDDGSTDNSSKICDHYAEEHSNIYTYHKKNGGLSDARNYGISKSDASYILFIDGDDFIEKNSLKKIYNYIDKYRPDVVFLNAFKYYPDGRKILYDVPMDNDLINRSKYDSLEYLSNRSKYPTSAWSKIIKSSIVKQNLFIVGQLSEDYEWSLKIFLSAETFGYCDTDYYYYRQSRDGSITSKVGEKHFIDLLKIIDDMEDMSLKSEYREECLRITGYVVMIAILFLNDFDRKYDSILKSKLSILKLRKDIRSRIMYMLCLALGVRNVSKLLCLLKQK